MILCFRFCDRSDPTSTQPRVLKESPLRQRLVALGLRSRRWTRWRAERHARGDVHASPFVSMCLDPDRLAASTDRWAQAIVLGVSHDDVECAPDIGEFAVPDDRTHEPSSYLARNDTELLFIGHDLQDFLIQWHTNQFSHV